MSKPLRKSHTAQAATVGFLTLLVQTGYALWDSDIGSFRAPTQIETGAVIAGALALRETLEGRKKAVEAIEGTEAEKTEQQVISQMIIQDSQEDDLIVDNEEFDGLNIDLSQLQGTFRLTAKRDTKLKTSTNQSSTLDKTTWIDVVEGQEFAVETWTFLEEQNLHIAVTLEGYEGNYFIYSPHFDLFSSTGKKISIESASSPDRVIDSRKTEIKLPGYTSSFYLEDQIYPGSNFFWYEALRNGERMPYQKSQVDNIIAVAKKLDGIRKLLGNRPMIITSWLRPDRPLDINKAVGGVRNSRHIQGDGVDFTVPSLSMYNVQDNIRDFCRRNGLGLGLGAARSFCHIDMHGFRVWNY